VSLGQLWIFQVINVEWDHLKVNERLLNTGHVFYILSWRKQNQNQNQWLGTAHLFTVFKNKKRPWQTSHSLFFTAHTVFYLGPAGCAWAKCWSPRPGKLEGSSLVSTPVYQVHFTFKNLFPKTHICFNKFCLSELTKRCTGQWKTLVRWWNRSW
jgi:hypothetical protein